MPTIYTPSQIAMTLATIAYEEAPGVPVLLAKKNFATGGQWSLTSFGVASQHGNQLFVAFNQTLNTYAIAIRGSVFEIDLAFFENWFDDLDVLKRVPWAYPSGGELKIASGAQNGLNNLVSAIGADGQSLQSFITETIVPSNAAVIVTGHSLGGNLASVLAPWLSFQTQGKVSVTPFTFAAPTAGNGPFAAAYDRLFPTAASYYNTLDIVPMAFASLRAIKSLYRQPGPAISNDCKDALDGFQLLLDASSPGSPYVQTNGTPLPGSLSGATTFFAEAGAQHSHDTYLKLLGAPDVPVIEGSSAVRTRT